MSSNFNCPKCKTSLYIGKANFDDLYKHISECCWQLKCTKCDVERYATEADLINHYLSKHLDNTDGNDQSKIQCPLCDKSDVRYDDSLLNHMRNAHSAFMPGKGNDLDRNINKKLPEAGDRVIAMRDQSTWQYHSASIRR